MCPRFEPSLVLRICQGGPGPGLSTEHFEVIGALSVRVREYGVRMDQHLGRQGVVRNLRDHLVDGTSAIVAGGPGMGKTTLLKQTAAALRKKTASVLINLQTEKPGDLARRIPGGGDPVVLLLDGCEALLPDPAVFVKRIVRDSLPPGRTVQGIVWAGDMAWREWAMTHRPKFGGPVRMYPLVVLPPREARSFLKSRLPGEVPPAEIERLLDLAGGHPYLLSWALGQADLECDAFFSKLWNAAGPEEQDLMNRLVEAGSWVFLEDLKINTRGRFPKKVLDRLASLGLVIRTLVDGAAAVKIISPLVGIWARKKGLVSA